MRLLTRGPVASLALLSLACARMEPPPGGPPDAAPPQLVSTVPDSFQVLSDFRGDVEFRFDEVISEGGARSQGTGTGDLERLVILSPSSQVPRVRWRRNRIAVRPDEGWQPDRIYRVELLPGVTDLRRNRLDRGAMVTFSTGAPPPQTTFAGLVVDWTSARPAPGALVVALKLPDSLPYRALADSSGRFSLGPLPAGEYVVSGVLDENRNHFAEPREAFDSVRAARGDSTLELWAFVHDTSPPRIRSVTQLDSVSASVELTQPLDPRQRLQPSAVRLSLLPDSTPVTVASILPKPLDDSLHARRPAVDTAAADTAAARDAARARPPRPGARPGGAPRRTEQLTGRPPLTNQLVLRSAAPWKPGAGFVVEVRGVRNVTGTAGDVVGTLVIPEPPARDTTAPTDTLRPPLDTTRSDSVPPNPGPAKKAPSKPAPAKPAPTKPAPPRPATPGR